ncbi:MAG: hypothetical protein JSU95_07350 [Betaproteobacteria bacterium]|nr:MAG: hypothetical protein JSU95_07350 [Betaproteobacteria bacterium]
MPEFLVQIWSRYEDMFWLMAIVSVATLVISIILVPVLIALLPADFYAERNHRRRLFEDRPLLRALFLLVKNALGAVLFIAGTVMFFLPGQGLITMLAGLALLNFPGKRKLEMRFLHLPKVLSSINWLRVRAGREPLTF